MIKFSEWEQTNFRETSNEPGLTVVFPSRDTYFSPELMRLMRLENSTCPKTLDQWYELCHPSDHAKISKLEQLIYNSHENFFSLTRKLYCGDGVYRNFRIDAFIQRHADGRPIYLYGNEIPGLNAWLAEADEGDKIECKDDAGRVRVLEAVRVAGVMTLNDVTIKEDLEHENLILRHEISRRIFSPFPESFKAPSDSGRGDVLFNVLRENLDAALNILTGNSQLKALKRSLNSPCLNVAVAGLSGGGKSSLINALTGEKFIFKDIPVIYREGERKSAKIFYQDGHVIELGMRSEDLGVINKATKIEIMLPGALIPEGICLIDTPGWDSLNGAGTLKNLLPEFDFIIYVLPVRSRLKGADYKFIDELGAKSGKIIFVLSKIDLESPDTEAGKIIRTQDEKILDDIATIKRDLKRFNGLDVEIIPVSAKIAGENFFSRNSDAWKNSNIERVIDVIKFLSKNPRESSLSLRAERVLKIIESSRELSQWQLDPIIKNLNKLGVKENLEIKGQVHAGEVINPNIWRDLGKTERHLLSSLITSMREHGFKGRFFSLGAFNGKRKTALFGAERNMNLKLLARLAHNLKVEKLPDGGVSESEWLCTSELMPFGCIRLAVSALASDEIILIAPPDHLLKEDFQWKKIFEDYTPVVSVDLARIESGLSDLAYAPYSTGLAISKWVLAFPNGGLLGEELGVRSEELKEKVKNFCEANGFIIPEFFIYEGYTIF
ncbi:MAG: 50S ribosome-binding GTPase [Synergistaceae bacterium]|nr:50S ribosome-binding GTPase [Synergistaceae bacterium]